MSLIYGNLTQRYHLQKQNVEESLRIGEKKNVRETRNKINYQFKI